MRKKVLALLMAVIMMLSLCTFVSAGAETACVSPQKLMVDGAEATCEVYNIDGYNYFKLRDLAYLLNGTGSQFSVGYDAASATATVATGNAYDGAAPGAFKDSAATAQKSAQTILVDGKKQDGIDAYNIGGYNFFKLRDLSSLLYFSVDFDAATNTACIYSEPTEGAPLEYRLLEYKYSDNEGDSYKYVYTYDRFGHKVSETYTNDAYDSKFVTNYSYDAAGNLVGEVEFFNGELEYAQTYTYDTDGNLLTVNYEGAYGNTSTRTYTYDAKGNLLTEYFEDDYYAHKTTYGYDDQGNQISKMYSEIWENGDGLTNITTNRFDDNGNLLVSVETGEGYSSKDVYTYDKAGNVLTHDFYYNGEKRRSEVSTYSENGLCLTYREETYYLEAYYDGSETVYTYDGNFNLTKSVCTDDSGIVTTVVYVYNDKDRTYTQTETLAYPPMKELYFEEDELTLAIGDRYYFLTITEPWSAKSEAITWKSSSPMIVSIEDGYATAKATGTATITATSESGKKATCEITVVKDKFVLTADKEFMNVSKNYGGSVTFTVKCVGAYESTKLTYVVGDDAIAKATWDSEWTHDYQSDTDSISLHLTGLSTGSTNVTVYVDEYPNIKLVIPVNVY